MMEDSTRILDAGTEDYPLDAGLASSAETCPFCSSTIAPGSQFCPSCGYQRGTWAASASQAAVEDAVDVDRGPGLFELVDADGNSYPLPAGETVIGRGEVDLQIANGYLSRRHALFLVSEDSVTFSDLGSANGSFVGDLKLDRETPHPLEDGQQIRLGQLDLTLRRMESAADATQLVEQPVETEEAPETETEDVATESADTVESDERPLSRWTLENDSHGSLSIPVGELTLGRSASKADLQISGDGYVSGLHGMLTATDDELSYTDLGSTNGSMVNGEALPANEEASLSAGDNLQLGQTSFVVGMLSDDDQPEETASGD